VEGKTLVQELSLNPGAEHQVLLLLPATREQHCQGSSRYHHQQQQQRCTAGSGRRCW
jgi:hypothetical protein